jgi:hypothetical protein
MLLYRECESLPLLIERCETGGGPARDIEMDMMTSG